MVVFSTLFAGVHTQTEDGSTTLENCVDVRTARRRDEDNMVSLQSIPFRDKEKGKAGCSYYTMRWMYDGQRANEVAA